MINICLIEDNKSYAETLVKILNQEADIYCAAWYDNVAKVDMKSEIIQHTDLFLLDINLPDGNGIDLLSSLKLNYPDKTYLILTVYDDEDKLFHALKSGANGYILKSETPSIIIDNIRSASIGYAPMSLRIAKRVVDYFHQSHREKKLLADLTSKENEILEQLSQGLLYKEIAELQQVTIDTIKKHCGNIYRKLHVGNKVEALNIYNQK